MLMMRWHGAEGKILRGKIFPILLAGNPVTLRLRKAFWSTYSTTCWLRVLDLEFVFNAKISFAE